MKMQNRIRVKVESVCRKGSGGKNGTVCARGQRAGWWGIGSGFARMERRSGRAILRMVNLSANG